MKFNVYQPTVTKNIRGHVFFERGRRYLTPVTPEIDLNSKIINEAVEQAKTKINAAQIPPKGLKVILEVIIINK